MSIVLLVYLKISLKTFENSEFYIAFLLSSVIIKI